MNTTTRQRATERLMKLTTKHHVRKVGNGLYAVLSGRSGNEYLVDVVAKKCSCAAASFKMYCDHQEAARLVAAVNQPKPSRTKLVPSVEYRAGGVAIRGYSYEGWEV